MSKRNLFVGFAFLSAAAVILTADGVEGVFQPIEIRGGWDDQFFLPVSMALFNGEIYLGTRNDLDPDFPPTEAGCQVIHLFPDDGAWNWRQVNDNGFGILACWNSFSAAQMTVFKDQLYVGVWNNDDGAQLWRTKAGVQAPVSNDDWERVDQLSFYGFAVTSLQEFDGYLYAGIFTQKGPFLLPGCRIWRSLDGESWAEVSSPGFGDWGNSDATTMAAHNGHLYVGTENGYYWDFFGIGSGTQIWRTDGDIEHPFTDDWELLSRDGFGEGAPRPENQNTTAMISFEGELFVGVSNPAEGAEVWSYDGANWIRRADAGIDNPGNHFVSYHSFCLFADSLILGTRNPWTGAEVWRYSGSTWYQINIDSFGIPTGAVEPLFVIGDILYAVTSPTPDLASTRIWATGPPGEDDPDMDAIPEMVDNCPIHANPDQEDDDGDGVGDFCDDDDGDAYSTHADCDDTNPEIHPGAHDACGDEIDSDCNGFDTGPEYPGDGIDSNCNGFDDCRISPAGTRGPIAPVALLAAAILLFFLRSSIRQTMRRGQGTLPPVY